METKIPFYKRKVFVMPLLAVFALTIISAATYAYFHSVQVDLTVTEARSSADVDFSLSCYSGETVTKNLTIHNSANVQLCANLEVYDVANPSGVTFTHDLPRDITLAANSDTVTTLTLTCDEVSEVGIATGKIGYSKIACS
jgi:predicted ribosomally synthesized peptide with SipW-like signal peptide